MDPLFLHEETFYYNSGSSSQSFRVTFRFASLCPDYKLYGWDGDSSTSPVALPSDNRGPLA
jgi:hypothetical protein